MCLVRAQSGEEKIVQASLETTEPTNNTKRVHKFSFPALLVKKRTHRKRKKKILLVCLWQKPFFPSVAKYGEKTPRSLSFGDGRRENMWKMSVIWKRQKTEKRGEYVVEVEKLTLKRILSCKSSFLAKTDLRVFHLDVAVGGIRQDEKLFQRNFPLMELVHGVAGINRQQTNSFPLIYASF